MNPFVRRIARKIVGLPPYGTAEPTTADITDLSDRINAMDKGLQDLIHANRSETSRALVRMRAELDAVIAQLQAAEAGQAPTDALTRSSRSS